VELLEPETRPACKASQPGNWNFPDLIQAALKPRAQAKSPRGPAIPLAPEAPRLAGVWGRDGKTAGPGAPG